MRILNTFSSTSDSLKYYNFLNDFPVVFKVGEYSIIKQFDRSFIHCYKNIAITNRCGADKQLLIDLHSEKLVHPMKDIWEKRTTTEYGYLRAKEYLKKGLELLEKV